MLPLLLCRLPSLQSRKSDIRLWAFCQNGVEDSFYGMLRSQTLVCEAMLEGEICAPISGGFYACCGREGESPYADRKAGYHTCRSPKCSDRQLLLSTSNQIKVKVHLDYVTYSFSRDLSLPFQPAV
jgi:hypothetical protein